MRSAQKLNFLSYPLNLVNLLAVVMTLGCASADDPVSPPVTSSIAGTWVGTQTTFGVTYSVRVVLTGPEGGTGVSHPPTGTCSGILTGTGHSGNVYNFRSTVTSGPCVDSDVRAVVNSSSMTAEIRYAGTATHAGTAQLTRQ
jgi:hypothetical protein